MITELTRQYWLDVALAWAEDRLSPPQLDEFRLALNLSKYRKTVIEEIRRAVIQRMHTIGSEIVYDDERCRCLENAMRTTTFKEDTACYVSAVATTELRELFDELISA